MIEAASTSRHASESLRATRSQFATTHPAKEYRAHALPSYAPELNFETNGTICAATFSATASGTPTRRSSTPVAMPGTPSWPNPRLSSQLERENGHRSKLRAVGIILQARPRIGLGNGALPLSEISIATLFTDKKAKVMGRLGPQAAFKLMNEPPRQ